MSSKSNRHGKQKHGFAKKASSGHHGNQAKPGRGGCSRKQNRFDYEDDVLDFKCQDRVENEASRV